MKDKYIKLKAMLLTGSMVLTSSVLTGCNSKNNETQSIVAQGETKHFGIGEHIISVPIKNDIRTDNFQHDYHPGYEPVGISIAAWGGYIDSFGGCTIIYANTEEVKCSTNLTDKDGNYLYVDFGTPVYYNEDKYDTSNNIKEFDIGEHIISIPIKEDNRSKNFQYEYHEGYEVVGIATSAWGAYTNSFGGGVILYKNITPVKCNRGDNGYTTFGIPFEIEKEKTLK